MFKRLAGLGITFATAAEALGIRPSILYRALHQGEWPNRETLQQFENYLKLQKELRRKKMITKKSLTDEVLQNFGLKRDPFTDEIASEEDLKETKQTRQALAKMQGAVTKHGWFALTGPKGSGKTQILKRFRSWLKSRKGVVLVEPNTVEGQYLGPSGLCDAIMRGLGAVYNEHGRLEQRGYELRLAVQAAQASGVKIVVLIDEAHLLRDDVLLACKRLYELDRQFGKPIAFILVGQDKLAARLKTNMELSEVAQRVDLFELGGLNGELGAYIEHKLERAGLNGASADVFDKSAIREMSARLKQVTGDTPLAANNLAAAAMIVAHELGEKKITAETIRNIPMSF
ncbi:MAG TPA: AAA family ATPase [Candidatus Acidoferrales bacterium]|nr:AAA family ATPase [Candidatus Acidoferrales bacterium]